MIALVYCDTMTQHADTNASTKKGGTNQSQHNTYIYCSPYNTVGVLAKCSWLQFSLVVGRFVNTLTGVVVSFASGCRILTVAIWQTHKGGQRAHDGQLRFKATDAFHQFIRTAEYSELTHGTLHWSRCRFGSESHLEVYHRAVNVIIILDRPPQLCVPLLCLSDMPLSTYVMIQLLFWRTIDIT